jgi:hypothetical protein
MCVLYQQAIIWVLPVYSTIEKKVEKKVSPPISSFSEHKRWKLFSHLFWFPDLFMNSCSMWNISLIKIKKIRWTDPISLPCRGRPAALPPIVPSSPIAATAIHRDLYAAHRDHAAVPAC